ncbi:hypothetical protein O9992_17865 [Vibrio lentus]|nr:hypothetical protein [Vibrio lentus]
MGIIAARSLDEQVTGLHDLRDNTLSAFVTESSLMNYWKRYELVIPHMRPNEAFDKLARSRIWLIT